MLDVFLALFVLAGFVAALLDLQRVPRPAGRGIGQWLFGRPWRLVAGLLIGAIDCRQVDRPVLRPRGSCGLVVACESVARRGRAGDPETDGWGRARSAPRIPGRGPADRRAPGGRCRCSSTWRPTRGRGGFAGRLRGGREAGGTTSRTTRWPWPGSTPDSKATIRTSPPRGRGSCSNARSRLLRWHDAFTHGAERIEHILALGSPVAWWPALAVFGWLALAGSAVIGTWGWTVVLVGWPAGVRALGSSWARFGARSSSGTSCPPCRSCTCRGRSGRSVAGMGSRPAGHRSDGGGGSAMPVGTPGKISGDRPQEPGSGVFGIGLDLLHTCCHRRDLLGSFCHDEPGSPLHGYLTGSVGPFGDLIRRFELLQIVLGVQRLAGRESPDVVGQRESVFRGHIVVRSHSVLDNPLLQRFVDLRDFRSVRPACKGVEVTRFRIQCGGSGTVTQPVLAVAGCTTHSKKLFPLALQGHPSVGLL